MFRVIRKVVSLSGVLYGRACVRVTPAADFIHCGNHVGVASSRIGGQDFKYLPPHPGRICQIRAGKNLQLALILFRARMCRYPSLHVNGLDISGLVRLACMYGSRALAFRVTWVRRFFRGAPRSQGYYWLRNIVEEL